MKTVIVAFIGIGLCLQARSATLSTGDGVTYQGVTSERVDPDGLFLEYTLPGGGLGMAKVKFTRLTADQQKQYGYDPDKARDFEAKVAKATEDFRQECIKWDEAAKAQRAAQEAQDDQQEKVMTDRITALAQLKQAEANLAQVAPNASPDNYYGGSYGYGYGYGLQLFARPHVGPAPPAKTVPARPMTPVPFTLRTPPIVSPQHNGSFNHSPSPRP